jgi:hypothetical protein
MGTIQKKMTENMGADSGDPENICAQFRVLPSAKLKSSNVSICVHKFSRKWNRDGSNLTRQIIAGIFFVEWTINGISEANIRERLDRVMNAGPIIIDR